MAKSLILPRVHARVLCDAIKVSQDEEGVCDLRGVRTQVVADSFPRTHTLVFTCTPS